MSRAALVLLALPLACGDKDPEDTGDPEADADTDADADADADADGNLDGEVVLEDGWCTMPSSVNVLNIAEGMTACDDDGVFMWDSGGTWEEWWDEEVDTPAVDASGSFQATLDPGDYAVRYLEDCYGCTAFSISEAEVTDVTLSLYEAAYADKPNVYLYPTEPTAVRVRVPADRVSASDPQYPRGGWQALAMPSGQLFTKEGRYDYLFYELVVSTDRADHSEGWCVSGELAQASVEDAMALYGFQDNEIADFVQFWDPWFPEADEVTIHPWSSELPGLGITPRPDSLLRVWFVVEDGCHEVSEPVIEPMERTGFVATEWGVVLDEGFDRGWVTSGP